MRCRWGTSPSGSVLVGRAGDAVRTGCARCPLEHRKRWCRQEDRERGRGMGRRPWLGLHRAAGVNQQATRGGGGCTLAVGDMPVRAGRWGSWTPRAIEERTALNCQLCRPLPTVRYGGLQAKGNVEELRRRRAGSIMRGYRRKPRVVTLTIHVLWAIIDHPARHHPGRGANERAGRRAASRTHDKEFSGENRSSTVGRCQPKK